MRKYAFSLALFLAIAVASVPVIGPAGAQGAMEGSTAGVAANVTVYSMRLVGDQRRTRLVIDLETPPQFAILRLSDPYRLVIDLPRVIFTAPGAKAHGRGLIAGYRFGLIAPEKARIVLDLIGPVDIAKTFALPAVLSPVIDSD